MNGILINLDDKSAEYVIKALAYKTEAEENLRMYIQEKNKQLEKELLALKGEKGEKGENPKWQQSF